MASTLLGTLRGLNSDPTLLVYLYKQLFEANFLAVILKGSGKSWSTIEFLTYDTIDNYRELPLFTAQDFVIEDLDPATQTQQLGGQHLWVKLLEIIDTANSQIAIDPGQTHGVRVTKEMVLGMINSYGEPSKE